MKQKNHSASPMAECMRATNNHKRSLYHGLCTFYHKQVPKGETSCLQRKNSDSAPFEREVAREQNR